MFNADQLLEDAKVARLLAESTAAASEDSGTCNLDATFFSLKRGERTEPVVRALRAAGLQAEPYRWFGRGVMVQPPGAGQANKRYAANQALYASLSRAGWPVSLYYQMD